MKRILFILFAFSCFYSEAQLLSSVITELTSNKETKDLGKEMLCTIFVMEKGKVELPRQALIVPLQEKERKKIGTDKILIALLMDDFRLPGNTPIEFELTAIPNAKHCYYSKKATFTLDGKKITVVADKEKGLREAIAQKKTINESEIEVKSSYKYDFRDIDYWIDCLDSKETITVADEDDETRTEDKLLGWIAHNNMDRVQKFAEGLLPLPEFPLKKDWKEWWQRLQNLTIAPLEQHYTLLPDIIRCDLITADAAQQKIYVINYKPNKKNKTPHILQLSPRTKEVKKGYIFNDEQSYSNWFSAFYAEKDTLYAVSEHFLWSKYVPVANDTAYYYKEVAQKDVYPYQKPSDKKRDPSKTNKNYVEYSYATPNYLYVLYKDYNSKNRDMYVLTLSTKTGNILGIVPLSKLLGNPKETNRHYLNYPEMQTTDDFIWCTEIDKKIYHLRIHGTELVEQVVLGEKFQWGPQYLSWDKQQFYTDKNDDVLEFYTIESPSRTIKTKTPGWKGTAMAVVDTEGIDYFYATGNGCFYVIKKQRLSKSNFQPIGKPEEIFYHLPTPFEKSGYISDLRVLKVGSQYHLFFEINNQIYWVAHP